MLGPFPLILFVNDLPLHSTQNLGLYADDSTLHSSGNSIKKLNDTLSAGVENIEQWSESNGMVVNCKKTKSMVLCTYKKSAKIGVYNFCIKHKNTVLENVKSEKLLGVKIDNHLSWKAHVDDLASNLSKLIALFRRIKIYLPFQTRILFYIKHSFNQGLITAALFGDNRHTHQEYTNYQNLY